MPGFFGFRALGSLNYFQDVGPTLGRMLRERGIDATIVECPTQPTGSLRNRADRLLEEVLHHHGDEAQAIHFVGHSTGGLDVRLLVTPGVRLRDGASESRVGLRTRSVTTISTPHFGTPLASFFTTFQGRQVLQLLSILATSIQGRHGIYVGAQLLRMLARADELLGRRNTLLDSLSRKILRSLNLRRDDELWQFLREVASDQGAIIQLTPEGMHLYNAAVTDRPGVSYRCVITVAPPTRPRKLLRRRSLGERISSLLFLLLQVLSSREHGHYPYPSPAADHRESLESMLPFPLTRASNDGVVPALSQIYGEPLAAVQSDHLDVVGQFQLDGAEPWSDWLASGSQFDRTRFDSVWSKVADGIQRAHEPQRETIDPRLRLVT